MADKKVFSIVVTYNGKKWADKCFRSLESSDYNTNVIAIDNDSSDGTPEYLSLKYPGVDVIKLDSNIGFGRANNIGIQRALKQGADFIFLLNQDAWIEPDTLQILLNEINAAIDIDLLSPMHFNGSGTALDFQFSRYLDPVRCPGLISDLCLRRTKSVYKISDVNAAAWFMSREMVEKVGLFDEQFFIYGEDDNYRDRVHYEGFHIGITPLTKIYHDTEDRPSELKKVWKEYSLQEIKMRVIALNPNHGILSKLIVVFRKSMRYILINIRDKSFLNVIGNIRALASGIFFTFRYDKTYKK